MSTTEHRPASGRRRPQQERSRAKVDAMLDAAEVLVTERGADKLTTTLVAERAGVAVGSVYQYFDSVAALVDALVERHAERFADRLAAELAARRFTRKRDAANATVDALVDFARTDAAFGALWRTAPRATSDGLDGMAEVLAAIVERTLAEQGLADPDDPDFVREVQVQLAVADALVRLAFRRDPQGDAAVLAHLRRLFDLDVEPVVDPAALRRRRG